MSSSKTNSSSGSGSGSGTPARGNNNHNSSSNNYAAPHTPIASAKRPRASLTSPAGSQSNSKLSAVPSTPLIHEDRDFDENETHNQMDPAHLSPMHKARPLVIKEETAAALAGAAGANSEENIFSPMLLLHQEGEDGDDDDDDDNDNDNDNGKNTPHEHEHEHEHEREHGRDQEEGASDDEAVEGETTQHEDDEPFVEDDGSSRGSVDEDEFNPYVFIKSLPPYDVVEPLRPPIALPPKDPDAKPISLVLDLDETLVHCTVEPVDDADLTFPVVFHGMTYQVHVRLRPHLFTFLERIKDKYEVIVFTASQQVYADELLNLIDPDGKYIHHRMFRESCLAVEGNFLKDLTVLGRDLTQSVLVDNSPHAFGYQVDNGIPIESWFDDPDDTELLKLERFLRTLHGVKDCRTVVRKTFKTYKLIEEA